MNKRQMLWQLTAEQFAAFELQLYLDTHPWDKAAIGLFANHKRAAQKLEAEYEEVYGALRIEIPAEDSWCWTNNPWPWEREAN